MMADKMNVVYITDENYAMPTCISAFSLICNQNPATQIEIYFIVNDISMQSKEKFMSLETGNAKIHCIEVRDDKYTEMEKSCMAHNSIHVSRTAMFKFDLPQMLGDVEKVLYLDGDTLVLKDLSELYNTSLEGFYVAAADDEIEKIRHVSPLFTANGYFNSGVMLLNLSKMREESVTEKLVDYRAHGTNFFMDQDALNAVLGGKKLTLPLQYNFLTTIINNYDEFEIEKMIEENGVDGTETILKKISIVHCTDKYKPWKYNLPWFSDLFKEFYYKSPYSENKLILQNLFKEYTNEISMLRNRIDELDHRVNTGDDSYPLKPYEQKIQGKRVALYGAGKMGKGIKARIGAFCDIAVWVDGDYRMLAKSDDISLQEVKAPDELKKTEFDYVLIAIADQSACAEVKKYLIQTLSVPREKIVLLNDRILQDKVALEVADLFKKWRGNEYQLAAQYIGKISNAACAGQVKHIGMVYRWLTVGGLQRVIALLSFLFCEMGYTVTLILETAEEIAYQLPEGINIEIITAESDVHTTGNYLPRANCLRNIIREKKIDTIIYHGASSHLLLYDLLVCKKSNVYFVVVKHEMFSQYMSYRSDTLYKQQNTFRLLDRLVALGEDECNFWSAQDVRCECISNPTGEYAVSGKKRTGTENSILWLGRLARLQKQCMDIIPIMREVVKTIPNAHMKVYGNEVAPGIINELNREIEKYHLENNIEYCGFADGNVGEIYREAAVFLVTSEYESFPLTIYESKRNGVPLVTYKMPYLDILKNGLGYIAVDNDNAQQAAAAIVELLENKELRERLSQEAYKSVESFNNERVKKEWKHLLTTLNVNENTQDKCYSSEEVKTLLQTMLYHYHKGIVKGADQNSVQQSGLAAILEHYCQYTQLSPVIYPFGTVGKRVQKILREQLHRREAFVVDNKLTNNDANIKSVDELKKMDCSKYLFFICCKRPQQHEEIMRSLQGVVPGNNIIDLYPV